MTETLVYQNHCLLWERTRDLAKDYGYEMSVNCPLDKSCVETECPFLDPVRTLVVAEAITTERKLAALRRELKHYTKGDSFQYEL